VADPWAGAKEAAARHAVATRVRPGLTLALGTGSTAAWAVRALAERFPGERFDCVSSSLATEELARSLGLAVRDLAVDDRFDVMLDGADEVSPSLDLTKGGGGALFREKFLARLSKELVILVDPSKIVRALGERSPIPVEVVPFARPVLVRELRAQGYEIRFRLNPGGQPFLTDNGNQLLDLVPRAPLDDPKRVDAELRALPGVVETGIFPGLASRVVIGQNDGRTEERLPTGRPRA